MLGPGEHMGKRTQHEQGSVGSLVAGLDKGVRAGQHPRVPRPVHLRNSAAGFAVDGLLAACCR